MRAASVCAALPATRDAILNANATRTARRVMATETAAEQQTRLLYSEIGRDFAALRQLAEGINEMNGAEREAFFADVRWLDFSPPDREPELDIDFQPTCTQGNGALWSPGARAGECGIMRA